MSRIHVSLVPRLNIDLTCVHRNNEHFVKSDKQLAMNCSIVSLVLFFTDTC